MSATFAVILLSLLSGSTTLVGVALALRLGRNPAYVAFGIGFSVGIMLLISVLELIPEARAVSGTLTVGIAVAGGMALFVFLHWLLPHIHLVEEQGALGNSGLRTAYLVMIGLVLHDVPEGFAMANSFLLSPSLGVLVAAGIALHNIPEELAIAMPAVVTRRPAMLVRAALISAAAEPAGAIIGLVSGAAMPASIPVMLGAAAGAMIYISLHELVPMGRRYGRNTVFALGLLASGAVYWPLSQLR